VEHQPRIAILGPVQVWTPAGQAVPVAGGRLRRLLVRLAADPGHAHGAAELTWDVWGDEAPAGAVSALQSLVSRLRRVLPDAIESGPAGYRLALAAGQVDAHRFLDLVARGQSLSPTDPAAAASTLTEALGLWRGEPLVDAAGADFAVATLARLAEARLAAIEERCDARLRLGGGPELLTELAGLVSEHPLRERLRAGYMRALNAAGRPADALATYEALRASLRAELGVDPAAEVREVHLAILRGQPTETGPRPLTTEPTTPEPAAGTSSPPGSGAPSVGAPLTSFVGRDADLRAVSELVRENRLVTLTGPGGAGKTRLAVELARRLGDGVLAGLDGIWLVELAPVREAAQIPDAILTALGAHERKLGGVTGRAIRGADAGDALPLDRAAALLASRSAVLVVDNCEHLVDGVAAVADTLLARCPRLRVLATSREGLGITGEVLYPVGSLALPEGEVTASEALDVAAVRLFADRGRAVRTDFAVDDDSVRDVVRVCQALDGLPLAIELAAARLRVFSPAAIADRLDDRFHLLTQGSRVALPRHQTLRAVVDWSWELLAEPERVLLRRLAVFTGGADYAAIERVCVNGPATALTTGELLPAVSALVDKSLITVGQHTLTGQTRYRLLETIRAYGQERLVAAGERDAMLRAHADYFGSLTERAAPHLLTRDQLTWLARLDADYGNVRAALAWAIDAGEASLALRMVGSLGWYWLLRARRGDAADLGSRALELPVAATDETRAIALAACGVVAMSSSLDRTRPAELLEEAAAWTPSGGADARPLPAMLVGARITAGLLAGDNERTWRQLDQYVESSDPWCRALARLCSGWALVNEGRADEGRAAFQDAVARFTAVGDRWGTGQALLALADDSAMRGLDEEVLSLLERARSALADLGGPDDVAQMLVQLARESSRSGEVARARAELAAAARIAGESSSHEMQLLVDLMRADLDRWEGELESARALIAGVFAVFGGQPPSGPGSQLYAYALGARGYVEVAAGALSAARVWCARAADVAITSHDLPITAQVAQLAATIELTCGQPDRAAWLLGIAQALRGVADERDPDVIRVREGASALLGQQRYATAFRRGAELSAARALHALAEVTSAARALESDTASAWVRSGDGRRAVPAE
jgi:predicted ATPase/DNA-binding SARP family transcriptional activator